MTRWSTALGTGALLLVLAACDKPDPQAEHVAEVAASGGTVDSVLPIAEHLRRFRKSLAERPDSLRNASASLDELVERWAAAVQARDTVALNAMIIDRVEFAWLLYPDTRLAKPPYEMPPGLLWEQMLANSDDGAKKALARFGGRALSVRSVRCPAPADTEGANLVRQNCVVRLRSANDTVAEGRFFGSILERENRFKFVGLANKL